MSDNHTPEKDPQLPAVNEDTPTNMETTEILPVVDNSELVADKLDPVLPEEESAEENTVPFPSKDEPDAELPPVLPSVEPEATEAPETPGVTPSALPYTNTYSTQPQTGAPLPRIEISEPPARGIRVGQFIWASIVAFIGVFMILAPLISTLDMPLLFISLIAVLGLSLMAAAAVSAFRQK